MSVAKSAVQLLKERGLHAKKALGQNFLLDPNVCERIAEAALPKGAAPSGTALEIGPGLGALTRPLLDRAARLICVERDRELVPVLHEEFREAIDRGALEVREGDALEADWAAILDGSAPRVLVGNLPYLITGRLLEKAIAIAERVDRAVFMVQAEVADRLVSPAGGDAYGALSVFTQAAFHVSKLLTVRGGAFHPRPDVDSTVIVLTPLGTRAAVEDDAFRAVVKAAFQARRKTLRNAWKSALPADVMERVPAEASVDLGARGETLDVHAFERVAALLRAANKP